MLEQTLQKAKVLLIDTNKTLKIHPIRVKRKNLSRKDSDVLVNLLKALCPVGGKVTFSDGS